MSTAIIVAIIGALGTVAAAAVTALIKTGDLQAYLKRKSEEHEKVSRENAQRVKAAIETRSVQYVLAIFFVIFISSFLFFVGSTVALMCCAAPTALLGDPIPLTGGAIGAIVGFVGAVALTIRGLKSSRHNTPFK